MLTRLATWWRLLPPVVAAGYAFAVVIPPLGLLIGIGLLFQGDEPSDGTNIVLVSIGVGLFIVLLVGS